LMDLAPGLYELFDPLVSDIEGLLADNDVQALAGALENNSSAGVLLFENVWATRFRDAVVNANGQLILSERIPRSVIEAAAAASQEEAPAQPA
ncbi:MAG TPA: hypothetical protein VHQ00_03030, partial [Chloroflexota bacterium]|nr:hypothetical protein [Chloroflexota bacterium]